MGNSFREVILLLYSSDSGMSEPAVGQCLCDLAFGLVRKLQGTEAKASGPDIQKNNNAQGSPDSFVSFRYK
jgi:hypothetical protein